MTHPTVLATIAFIFLGTLISSMGGTHNVPGTLIVLRLAFCGMVLYGINTGIFVVFNRKWGGHRFDLGYKVTQILFTFWLLVWLWFLLYRGLT